MERINVSWRWRPFNGVPEKFVQDIKLRNGDIVRQCWPNAGVWHVPDVEGNAPYLGLDIDITEAEYTRLSKEWYSIF